MAQTIYSGELNTGVRSGEVRAPYPAVLVDHGICHLMGFESLDAALKARAESESFTDFLAFEFQDGCWRPEGWTPAVEPVQEIEKTVIPEPPEPEVVQPEPEQESVVAPEMFNASEAEAECESTNEPETSAEEKIVKSAIFNVEVPAAKKDEPKPKKPVSTDQPDASSGSDLFGSSPAPAKKKARRSRARKPRKPKNPPSKES